jgi:hypothetical protein
MTMQFHQNTGEINRFHVDETLPDGYVKLVRDGEVLWFGRVLEVPDHEFRMARESYVSRWTYNDIAARAKATGKGIPEQ